MTGCSFGQDARTNRDKRESCIARQCREGFSIFDDNGTDTFKVHMNGMLSFTATEIGVRLVRVAETNMLRPIGVDPGSRFLEARCLGCGA